MWESTYAAAKPKYGEKRASAIAWTAVKKKFKKVEGKWVAKSSDFEAFKTVHYEFELESKSVTRSEDGEYVYYDYVLSSTGRDSYGTRFGEVFLKNEAARINQYGLVGRASSKHDLFDSLRDKGYTPEQIEAIINAEDTGIRAIAAKYENGKLKATVRVKKDLESIVDKFTGASIEASILKDKVVGDEFTQGKFVGFILTDKPSNPDAIRV